MSTILLYNGRIYTLDAEQPQAQAIALRDGRILAVGSEGKVHAAAGSRAEAINLQGRAVIPGLTDAHVHLTWHGLALQRVRLNDTASLAAGLQHIASSAARLPAGAWLRGGGWSHTDWGGQWPTSADLDQVCPDRPAMLVRKDGHSCWVNSRALDLAGIDDHTPDPPGGTIQRDPQGHSTGILLENAQELVRRVLPPPTRAERQQALQVAQAEALSYGLTSVHIPPAPNTDDGRETLSDLQMLRERGELRIRYLAHLAMKDLDAAIALGIRSGLGDAWIRIGGLKIFADGSLGSETAEMLAPYEDRQDTGTAMVSVADLNDIIARAHASGISVVVHAIGDAANRKVLDAIEYARNETRRGAGSDWPELALPDRIEHAQLVDAQDMRRFAHLGVLASMQPVHATSDMAIAEHLWGRRCATAYAWQSLHNAGAVLLFGSDAPVETFNPWAGIHAAVTRQRLDSTPPEGWYPEQCLDMRAALQSYCVTPALASGEAQEKGKLVPGMLADLAVLSVDPFHMQLAELHTVTVDFTVVAGQIAWERVIR